MSGRVGVVGKNRLDAVICALFTLTVALIICWQLFLPPVVGIADNNDFARITEQVGLAPVDSPGSFAYVHLRFAPQPRYRLEYLSSQLLLCDLAIALQRLLGHKEFDLRLMGLINAAAYLWALYWIARGLRLRAELKAAALAVAILFLADVRITSYFNSFYSESASVIFLLFTVGTMLSLGWKGASGWRFWLRLVLFLAFSLLLAFSKMQNLVFLVPLWFFGVVFALRNIRATPIVLGWLCLSAVCLLGGLWWGYTSHAYALTKDANLGIALYDEIKSHSPDFERDLREIGRESPPFTAATIARFYLRHPVRYVQLLERRAGQAFSHIGYGNYTKTEARHGYEQSDKFDWWWRFKRAWFPKRLWFIAGVLAITAAGGGWVLFRKRSRPLSHLGLVAGTLAVMAAGAYLVASTFEANGPEKHLFIFNVLFDLTLALGVLLVLLSRKRDKA